MKDAMISTELLDIKKILENDIQNNLLFEDNFNKYYKVIIELNHDFVILNEESMKKSYINELSCISILSCLLQRKLSHYGLITTTNSLLKKFDSSNLFNWYEIKENYFDDINHNWNHTKSFNGLFIANFYQYFQLKSDKKTLGQYYTPVSVIDKIFELTKIDFSDLGDKKILDPSCGSGVFFVRIIEKMSCNGSSIFDILRYVNNNLYGYDVNPFAICLTKMSLLVQLITTSTSKEENLFIYESFDVTAHIVAANTIMIEQDKLCFDYIIGNPPYFKLKSETMTVPNFYREVMFGQSNIYALFMAWAYLNIKQDGLVCFIVPQSMRSGLYFNGIRKLLSKARITSIFCINSKNRRDIFKEVEQAVMIIAFMKNSNNNSYNTIEVFSTKTISGNKNQNIISQSEIMNSSEAMLIPDSMEILSVIQKILKNSKTFQDVETDLMFGNGLLVWNQKKEQLSNEKDGTLPIIYANYISPFAFDFDPAKNINNDAKKRRPYCDKNGNEIFAYKNRRILVKRTSSMEKFDRIRACLIDEDFVANNQEYFVENHVNMLYNKKDKNLQIDINKQLFILALLNSNLINFIFKQKNGNTQVSANELNKLPYTIKNMQIIVDLMQKNKVDNDEVNAIIYRSFGLAKKDIEIIEEYKRSLL